MIQEQSNFLSYFVLLTIGIVIIAGCGLIACQTVPERDLITDQYSFQKELPNIVLIIIDTLRADKLGCYGFPEPISPEIDALAEQGVRFETVVAQSSWTRPSIGSLITGCYPRTIGLFEEKYDILPEWCTTLAEILKKNDYRTIGLTANPNINSIFNMHQGFDTYIDSSVIFHWMKWQKGQEILANKRLKSARELFNDTFNMIKNEIHPCFLELTLMDVHQTYDKSRSLIRSEFKDLFHEQKFGSEMQRRYLQAVRQISIDISDFIKRLSRRSSWENTLFIITSDHGQGLDDHPAVPLAWGHGHSLYPSQILVPLIFYHPNKTLSKRRVVENRIRLMDVMPTLLDMCSIQLPENISGHSFLDLLGNKKTCISSSELYVVETYRNANKIGVYSQDWIFIENRDKQRGCNPEELQPANGIANGIKTDLIRENPQLAIKYKRYIEKWEKEHVKITAIGHGEKLSPEDLKQLESLGYIN